METSARARSTAADTRRSKAGPAVAAPASRVSSPLSLDPASLGPADLISLQAPAGNEAVSTLLQRAPVAAPAPASAERYDVTIGSDSRTGITRQELVGMLKRHHSRIRGAVDVEKSGLADLKQIHDDQRVVAFISEALGGFQSLPDPSIFDPAYASLAEAKALIDSGHNLEYCATKLFQADLDYVEARGKVTQYREGTISGAEHSVTVLKVTAAAGAVAATVATGGAATAAGAGLLTTSVAIGGTAGLYSATQMSAGQAGEMYAGTRAMGDYDWKAILKKGGTDAVVGFVGALAGGALSKYLVKAFANHLVATLSEAELAAVADKLGVIGPLNPQVLVTTGQRFIIDFFAGVGVAPLTTSVDATLQSLSGQAKFPNMREFAKTVVKNMATAGIAQLFVAGLTHGWKAAGWETGFEPKLPTDKDVDLAFKRLEEGKIPQEGGFTQVTRTGKAGDVPDIGPTPTRGAPGQRLPPDLIAKVFGGKNPATGLREGGISGKTIADCPPEVKQAWESAVDQVMAKNTKPLTKNLVNGELYNQAREAFWRNVRNDPAAKKFFTDHGLTFGKTKTSAPLIDALKSFPGKELEFRITLDHIAPKASGGVNWQKALDADNLRFVTQWDNWLLAQIEKAHPALARAH